MTLAREIRSAFKALWDEVDRLPDRTDRWLRSLHHPEDADGEPVCRHCHQAWPCDDFVRIDQRITDRVTP